jgi:hypothetical protein
MSFLQPTFLYGLFALAIPIALHLLNLQRYKKQSFTNVAMLQMFEKTSRRKVQLKEWLVLVARCLFILFLVLTFAQPYIRADKSQITGISQATNYLMIDNSASMSRQDVQNQSLLERGRELYRQLINSAQEQSFFSVTTSNSSSSRSSAVLSKTSALRKLEEVPLYFNTSKAKKLDVSSRDFWLISDFQKSNRWWEELLEDTTLKANLVVLQENTTGNVFVDSVWVSDYPNPEKRLVEFTADIRWSGSDDLSDFTIRVLHNQALAKTLTTNLKPLQSNLIVFQVTYLPETNNTYTITFNDNPIVFDNSFYFSLPGFNQIKICLISDQNDVFRKVFSNPDLFKVIEMTPSNMDYSALEEAHVLVLSDMVVNYTILLDRIKQRASEGVMLILHPGAEKDTSLFKSLLGAFDISSQPLVGSSSSSEIAKELRIPSEAIDFFSDVLEKSSDKILLPQALPVLQIAALQPLIRTRLGVPIVSLDIQKNKKVAVFNTVLVENQGSLVTHSLFLPILYKIAFSSLPFSDQPIYTRQTEEFMLPQSTVSGSKPGEVSILMDSIKNIPTQYIYGDKLVLQIDPSLLVPGFFGIWNGSKKVAEQAYNAPKEESQTELYSVEELKNLYKERPGIQVVSEETIKEALDLQGQKGTSSLTWLSLIIALCFLAFEVVLLRLFRL